MVVDMFLLRELGLAALSLEVVLVAGAPAPVSGGVMSA